MKNIYIIVGVIVLLLMVLYLVFDHRSFEHLLLSSTSPDNTITVTAEYGDAFLFGPSEVHVYFKQNGHLFRKQIIHTWISNDGAELSGENCQIAWKNHVSVITLRGDEQGDEVYEIDFSAHEITVQRK